MAKNDNINSKLQPFQQMEARNAQLQGGIERATQLESEYANNEKAVGMAGTRYASADAFKFQQQINDVKLSGVNTQNFDSGKFDGLLSPQMKADLYQQRAMEADRQRVVDGMKTVGKAAGAVALGTVGAAAAMYGGPQAMMAAGAGSIVFGEKVISGAYHTAKVGRDYIEAGGREFARMDIHANSYRSNRFVYNHYAPIGNAGSPMSAGMPHVQKSMDDGRDMLAEQRKYIDAFNRQNGSGNK